MKTWRHRIADAIRLLGVAVMIVIALAATYLEWTGTLDIALLPYFMAFAAFCVANIVATLLEMGRGSLKPHHIRV
jgi:hypothetical protein